MHSTLMEGGGGGGGGASDEASDARDTFVDLGVLIVEGRVPAGRGGQSASSGRGYGEGPHCVRQTAGMARHDCDAGFVCQRAEKLRKHMQLLWENNVPMCVEVLLGTDCPCGVQRASCPEVVNVPSAADVLLEQWMVTMVAKKGVESAQMSARGLLQAVRSQLHFSQLSAWWSRSGGSDPAHIHYRVTVPGEAFASQFRQPPLVHSFPVASVGRNTSIRVSVRTAPRTEAVPRVLCHLHHEAGGGGAVTTSEDAASATTRGDKLLGESLLDPPQNLDHFSRKFQSPSRGGSPSSAEAPEHLLFPRSCRRESSPPSPPLGLQLHRLGREGLARRRDTSWRGATASNANATTTPLLDDRMQNVCDRPGKHHCRCDEELEPLGATGRRTKPPGDSAGTRSTRSRPAAPSPHESTMGCCSPPVDEGTTMEKTPQQQYLSACRGGGKEAYLTEGELLEKQVKRVKKEAEGRPGGSKLNLELSPQEFKEVLSVIRDRNTTLPHHGTKSLSRSPDDQLGTTASLLHGYKMKCCPAAGVKAAPAAAAQQPPCERMVYSARTSQAAKSVNTTTDKAADLFMDAILRSSDSAAKADLDTFDLDPFDLSKKISDISIDGHARKNGFSDFALGSGTKRKRFESNKSDGNGPAGESAACGQADGIGLRPEAFTMEFKKLSDGQSCLSTSIDERTLSTVPRTLKVNNIKVISDAYEKVPCDVVAAAAGKKTIKSSHSVISEGIPCPSDEAGGRRAATIKAKSDIKLPSAAGTEPAPPLTLCALPRIAKDPEHAVVKVQPLPRSDDATWTGADNGCDRPVPSASDKEQFRRSLDFAASMVFHSRTGLPLTSSPAPVRRNATCFDYDSTITSVSAIRSALFHDLASGAPASPSDDGLSTSGDDAESEGRSPCSPRMLSFPSPVRCGSWSRYRGNTASSSSLLGTFEESVLNGRLEPVSTVQGFTANLGASGSFCPGHVTLPVTVFFYTLGDNDKVSTPYLAHINLGKKGYSVPQCGTIQVTLFNPLGTVVKMFVVMYDLKDMPANSQTFLRQRTLYMPANTGTKCQPDNFQKWLRYLVHLRFSSSKSGRIYLHSDIRMIIFRKSDLDTATAHGVDMSYELRSFTQGPTNPKFSTRK